MITKNYFKLRWEYESVSVRAFTSEVGLSHTMIKQLEGKTSFPYKFELKKIIETEDGLVISDDFSNLAEIWPDYLPNNLAWPLMSERLKNIINDHLSGKEGINWISAYVGYKEEERLYYIPRFNKKLDVLDFEKTKYIPGTDQIVSPCFSLKKIQCYVIFHNDLTHELWKITPFLNVSDDIRKLIKKNGLKGMDFVKLKVAKTSPPCTFHGDYALKATNFSKLHCSYSKLFEIVSYL